MGLPVFLAVQDGMPEAVVEESLDGFCGIFVGGTTRWKLDTGYGWARLAHARGIRCHVGRVGTYKRVLWAHEIGADSIDSSLPLWTLRGFDLFRMALTDPHRAQGRLFS